MNKDKEKLLKAEKVCVCMHAHVHTLSCVQLFAIPWTVACQTPLSKRFPRQEYWSGLPFPSPGDLPDPGIEPTFPALAVDSSPRSPQESPLIYTHTY